MRSERRGLDEDNIADTSMLTDAVTSLINAFKQAGYNPPTSIQVDNQAFDKLLEEASKLYSSVNVRDSIANQQFSIANIMSVVLGKEKSEVDDQDHHHLQEQKDQQQKISATATKYECTDCNATFDTPAGHRKHYQAFHGSIEEPKVTEQAEI